MKTKKQLTHRFVICINNSEYPASLELHKIYRVLTDEEAERAGDLRIIDESGEDYLFSGQCFVAVDLPLETIRVLKKAYVPGIQHTS